MLVASSIDEGGMTECLAEIAYCDHALLADTLLPTNRSSVFALVCNVCLRVLKKRLG